MPKPKMYKPKSSGINKLKRVGKTAGVIALSAGIGATTYKVADRVERRKVFEGIQQEAEKTGRNGRFDSSSLLAELNKDKKPTEIYFYNKERLTRINIDVARLNQLMKLVPSNVQTNINKVIDKKTIAVAKEMQKNQELMNKISRGDSHYYLVESFKDRYRAYLLSLPMERLEKAFTKEEIKQIRAELNKIPEKRLRELNRKLEDTYEKTVSLGAFITLFLSAGLIEAIKPKKKNINIV